MANFGAFDQHFETVNPAPQGQDPTGFTPQPPTQSRPIQQYERSYEGTYGYGDDAYHRQDNPQYDRGYQGPSSAADRYGSTHVSPITYPRESGPSEAFGRSPMTSGGRDGHRIPRPPTADGMRGAHLARGDRPPGPIRNGLVSGADSSSPPGLERAASTGHVSRNQPANRPTSPLETDFGGSPFPTFPGAKRKTDLDEEQQILRKMGATDIDTSAPPNPSTKNEPYQPLRQRRVDGYGPRGAPTSRIGPQYYSPREMVGRQHAPSPTPYGTGGQGAMPERTMTLLGRQHPLDMRPHPRLTGPPSASSTVPPRPGTAQGPMRYQHTPMSHAPPQPLTWSNGAESSPYPPANPNASPPSLSDDHHPVSFTNDDFFDSYQSRETYDVLSKTYQPVQDATTSYGPAYPGPPPPGPGNLHELTRTKSQPNMRRSPNATFEMGVDAPPPMPGPLSHAFPPAPVRPGLMPNSLVSLDSLPPAPRNYGGSDSIVSARQQYPSSLTPLIPSSNATISAPAQYQAAASEPFRSPVTIDELERLRAIIKADSGDQRSALLLARRLLEAVDVLVPQIPDPKMRSRSHERYLQDAQKILKKLTSANNPDAMFWMADCLGRGLFGAEPDNKEAFLLYQSAAKLGQAAAAYRTAVCCEIGHEEGGGTRKDLLKAIQWYKRAAMLGDTPAMYKVGMVLLNGLLGQPKNPREAVSWLKRAADRADAENPHALHELGLLYESSQPNDAIIRDEACAFQLLQKAANLGYKFSQFRLGSAYEYGLLGCPVDPRLSIMWYSRAATQEEHQSELALSGWYLTGSDGVLAQSDTEAYLWARKAAIAGLAKAEYAMGYFTEVGIGVPPNLEDAKRWYWRAAAQDFPKARERLEDLKRSGRNAPRERDRISRSKIGKQQEGECTLM